MLPDFNGLTLTLYLHRRIVTVIAPRHLTSHHCAQDDMIVTGQLECMLECVFVCKRELLWL